MGTTRTFFKNSFMILLSSGADKLLSLVFFIFVTHYLGAEGFGKYSFIFAFITFFIVLSAFGMDSLIVREVAKDRSRAPVLLFNSCLLKTLLIVVCWIIVAVSIVVMHKDAQTNAGLLIIAFCLLPDSIVRSFKAVFSGYEQMEYNTAVEILFRVTAVALGLLVIAVDGGFVAIFLASLAASMLALFYTYYLYRKHIGPVIFSVDITLWRSLLRTSFPFLLTGVFITLYYRIDTVMLSFMKGDEVVGWYNAAHNLADSLIFIPTVVNGAIYPVFCKLHRDTKSTLALAFNASFKFLLLLAIPIGVGTTVLAPQIISLVFPAQFSNSVIALQIIIWSVMIVFMNAVMTPILYSADRQKDVAVIVSVMAVINIALNFLLIPSYSYVGASVSTIITELIGFVWLYRIINRDIVAIKPAAIFLKSCAATGLMALLVLNLRGLNIGAVIALGAGSYLLALVLLKTFDANDKAIFKTILPQKLRTE